MGSMFAILTILGLLAGGATMFEQGLGSGLTKARRDEMKDWLKQNYPELSETEITGLVAQYGDTQGGPWDITKWGDQSEWDDLKSLLNQIESAHEKYGDAPERPDLDAIQQEAYDELDAEYNKIYDLYNQSLRNTSSMLQNSLQENAQMFGDYRNQILTNEAMRQQAIAGATRFELDRQQRNAITRGASAAQRLVANINTQLGLQAQSAQQSLDTSNALAQNLLAHRQAQQGIRNDYMNAQNQYNSQMASAMAGHTRDRFNYGQQRKEGALSDWQYKNDSYWDKINDEFRGNSTGYGIYSRRYGSSGSGI